MIFKWNTEYDESFKILKEYLTASPILTYPCLDKEYILDTYTSAFGVGAVLSQISNQGKECVIAYYSSSMLIPILTQGLVIEHFLAHLEIYFLTNLLKEEFAQSHHF
jgi:hypothetical protein